jgi:hypothetical protein
MTIAGQAEEQHRPLGYRRKLGWIGALFPVVLAACGASPATSERRAEQSAPVTNTDPAPKVEPESPTGGLWDYGTAAITVMQAMISFGENSLSESDLEIMHENITRLMDEMDAFVKQAQDMRTRADLQTLQTEQTLIHDKYSAVGSALATGASPASDINLAIALNQTMTAADALVPPRVQGDFDGYYVFTDFPDPNRFDPRLATPTFVMAVTSWIGLRSANHVPLDPASRATLLKYADGLDWVVAKSRAAVTCETSREIVEIPGCMGRCETYTCRTSTTCFDTTMKNNIPYDVTSVPLSNPPGGNDCPFTSTPNPTKAHEIIEKRYGADKYAQVATAWRAYANPPNIALNRPAFQFPEVPWGPDWLPRTAASHGVDGNTDGNFWDNSVTHTDTDHQPWWWVDLGSVQNIRQINIYNRTDCCSSRLSHYQVWVSSDSVDGWDGSWADVFDRSDLTIEDGDGTPQRLAGDISARWVAVTVPDNFLSVAEVEVLGR